MGYAICTIIAKNYLAFARTLCDSFLESHPDGACYVLIIDDIDGYVDPDNEPFELIKLSELNVAGQIEMCFKYNIIELSTALKPYLLQYLLDTKTICKLLYLDPDIMVFNSLDQLYIELDSSDFIITPHIDTDYPDDNFFPNDAHIMKHGVFNLGFIGVKKCENTSKFLIWWQNKLYNKCVMEPNNGYFVDQKFIDLAITLFQGFSIIYNTGYNVAYWNLHSRKVVFEDSRWRCNNDKLYFFHFSNYKPEKPHLISREQTRHEFGSLPDIKKLYDFYKKRLENNRYYECIKWPYTYNCFSNKTKINDMIRKTYRNNRNIEVNNPFNIKEYEVRYRLLFISLILYKKCTKFLLSRIR